MPKYSEKRQAALARQANAFAVMQAANDKVNASHTATMTGATTYKAHMALYAVANAAEADWEAACRASDVYKKEATPADMAAMFTCHAKKIMELCNCFAYRPDARELAREYITWRQFVESLRSITTEHFPCALPEVPSLIGNDYYSGMIHLRDFCTEAAKRLCPGKEEAGGGAAPASKWQDIQRKLLKLYRQGEPYTSGRVLGCRVGCSAGTIGKAVKHSPDLQKWKAQRTKGQPKTQSLTAPVTGSIASDADDPANTLLDDEVDKTMKMLIACANPTERAKLVAMDKDERRRLAEAASKQSQDLFNEDHAPKGNRILGRKS